jgi:hypothetical protein
VLLGVKTAPQVGGRCAPANGLRNEGPSAGDGVREIDAVGFESMVAV